MDATWVSEHVNPMRTTNPNLLLFSFFLYFGMVEVMASELLVACGTNFPTRLKLGPCKWGVQMPQLLTTWAAPPPPPTWEALAGVLGPVELRIQGMEPPQASWDMRS